jgi:hypothetical protein
MRADDDLEHHLCRQVLMTSPKRRHGIGRDVPLAKLEARLLERWSAQGLTEAEARSRVEENDLPNVRFVTRSSRRSDLQLRLGRPVHPCVSKTEGQE